MDSEQSYFAKSLFLQGSYTTCISTIASEPTPPSTNLQLYAARAHIALNQADQAADLLQSLPADDLGVRAVTLLAEWIGTGESVADEVRQLLEELRVLDEAPMVRPVAATILHLEGETGEALHVLSEGVQGQDQECVALQVQVLLSLDRLTSARQVYTDAKTWADDSIIIQLCEAWIALKTGGEAYQSAFYVYDEIAQQPSANNAVVLNGKAIAQACQGHWPEAEAALQEASSVNPNHGQTLANQIALSLPSGKAATAADPLLQQLYTADPTNAMLADLATKAAFFDEVATRYRPSAAAAA